MRPTAKGVAGGRPPKFSEARRPITVTLPERILRKLESVNPDRAMAIVKCAEAVTGEGDRALRQVELVEVVPGTALIVMGPSRSLANLDWLRVVEIAPARFLLVLPTGTPVEVLEVSIHDLLDSLGEDEDDERRLLRELRDLLCNQRRQKKVSKAELVLVDVPGKK